MTWKACRWGIRWTLRGGVGVGLGLGVEVEVEVEVEVGLIVALVLVVDLVVGLARELSVVVTWWGEARLSRIKTGRTTIDKKGICTDVQGARTTTETETAPSTTEVAAQQQQEG